MIGGMVSVALLILTAAVHVYWAAGGRMGKSAAIPSRGGAPVLKPGRLATLCVALALLAAAAVVATQIELILPGRFRQASRILAGLTALAFLLRAVGDFRYVGFFKTVRDSRFAKLDTQVFSPLCALLAATTTDAVVRFT